MYCTKRARDGVCAECWKTPYRSGPSKKHDPATPLTAWRGEVLSLHVASIGRAAGLEVNGHGTEFIRRHKRRGGLARAFCGKPGARQHPEETNAPASAERTEFGPASTSLRHSNSTGLVLTAVRPNALACSLPRNSQ
jgi:hypothetical protein